MISALDRGGPDADRSGDAKPPLLVLGRVRVVDALLDVLDGDQALQPPVRVDDRELLDAVLAEDRLRLVERRPDRRGDQVRGGHQRAHRHVGLVAETEVAIREDPDQSPLDVHDRYAGDPVALHQLERLRHARLRAERDRLANHPGLGALHSVDLGHLGLDRQVAVQDTYAALAGQRDRQARLGDGVHGGRDDRDGKRDARRQPRRGRHVRREHVRGGRLQQHVVEGEALADELAAGGDQLLDVLEAQVNVH